MHVLIAEDDSFLRQVYTSELTKAGYTVTCAEDGEETMRKLASDKPDLLLLDVLMPKKDGFQVLEEKSKVPEIATIPVMMLTSVSGETDMQRAVQLGASDYFIKTNMGLDELVTLVRQMLPTRS